MPMKRLIHTAVLAAALAFALLLCGCSGAETSHKAPQRAAVESGERQFAQPSDGDFIAIFSTSLGEVRAVLYPDAAPMAVQNFVGLARSGYYDNTVIWRAQYGFAVQGGDAGGMGSGGTFFQLAELLKLAQRLQQHELQVVVARFVGGKRFEQGQGFGICRK